MANNGQQWGTIDTTRRRRRQISGEAAAAGTTTKRRHKSSSICNDADDSNKGTSRRTLGKLCVFADDDAELLSITGNEKKTGSLPHFLANFAAGEIPGGGGGCDLESVD